MQPIKLNKRLLVVLCMYPIEDDISQWIKILYVIISVAVFAFNAIGVIASVIFFMTYVNVDFEAALTSLFQILGWSDGAFIVVMGFISRHKIKSILLELQSIYDESK